MSARIIAGGIALLVGTTALGSGAEFVGPSPYLCVEDSPFDLSGSFVEDMEDGFNAPGVTAQNGSIAGPGGIVDSVDCDDGVIDGSGQQGRSFFGIATTGITFNFDPACGLPTQVGLVWTDGGATNTVMFEAWDANNVSLGVMVEKNVGDGEFESGTAEDRFFGVLYAEGISRVRMWAIPMGGGSGIEVDHLQYGPIGSGCTGDLNGDLVVDGADLGLLLAAWGAAQPSCTSPDLDFSGQVDGADLGLLLAAWGECP